MQENPHPYPSQPPWQPQQQPQYSSQSFQQYPPGYPMGAAPLTQSYQQLPQMTLPPQTLPSVPQKQRRWPWMFAIFVALIVGYAAGASPHPSGEVINVQSVPPTLVVAPAPLPAQTPPKAQSTQPPAQAQPAGWQTTHTFSGNGIKKTPTFTVADTWKVSWKCDPTSFPTNYNVIVSVFHSDNSLQGFAVNTICKKGNTEGSADMHQSGALYLYINSEGSWAVAIQELK